MARYKIAMALSLINMCNFRGTSVRFNLAWLEEYIGPPNRGLLLENFSFLLYIKIHQIAN